MELDDPQRTTVNALLDHAEEAGGLCFADIAQLVARLDLDDEAQGQIEEEARTRGIDLSDDCGRAEIPATHYLRTATRPPRSG
jgi:RNA polymerase primary sigma factor